MSNKVVFSFDKEKDLYNLWETCTAKSYGYDFSSRLPKELVEYCKDKKYEDCKEFINNLYKNIYSSGFVEGYADFLDKSWKKIEKEYFIRMDKIIGKKLKIKKINAYLTIAPRCPYDPRDKYFMVNFFANPTTNLMTAGHEIMHFYIHENYFSDIEKKIGNKKTHDLKEALTVLLNIEFRDLWYVHDNGYESHKEFREFISKEWKKEKNFDKLLIKCVEYMKKDVK